MKIAPPKHLSKSAQAWFKSMQSEYGITDSGGISLLTVAAESWQRAGEARVHVDRDGLVTKDRFGQVVPHPAAKLEREARGQLLAALKALALDVEPLKNPGRPVAPGYSGGRNAD